MGQPGVGVYPGTFDPVTNGHLDIITRATRIVDRLIVAIAANPGKVPMFSLQERVEMMQEQVALLRNGDGSRIEVRPFDELLMHFVEKLGATTIVRGLRAVSDFEYEFQRALLIKRIDPEIETVFMMTSAEYSFLSSSGVRELAAFGGKIDPLVPDDVAERLREHYNARQNKK